jgi:hypothetical protein
MFGRYVHFHLRDFTHAHAHAHTHTHTHTHTHNSRYVDRFVGIVEKPFDAFNWADFVTLSPFETGEQPIHTHIIAHTCTHAHHVRTTIHVHRIVPHVHSHALLLTHIRTRSHTAIPLHRIVYFKYGRRIVWDKRYRLDDVYGSQGGLTIDVAVATYKEDDYPPNPPNPEGFDTDDDECDDDVVAGSCHNPYNSLAVPVYQTFTLCLNV